MARIHPGGGVNARIQTPRDLMCQARRARAVRRVRGARRSQGRWRGEWVVTRLGRSTNREWSHEGHLLCWGTWTVACLSGGDRMESTGLDLRVSTHIEEKRKFCPQSARVKARGHHFFRKHRGFPRKYGFRRKWSQIGPFRSIFRAIVVEGSRARTSRDRSS